MFLHFSCAETCFSCDDECLIRNIDKNCEIERELYLQRKYTGKQTSTIKQTKSIAPSRDKWEARFGEREATQTCEDDKIYGSWGRRRITEKSRLREILAVRPGTFCRRTFCLRSHKWDPFLKYECDEKVCTESIIVKKKSTKINYLKTVGAVTNISSWAQSLDIWLTADGNLLFSSVNQCPSFHHENRLSPCLSLSCTHDDMNGPCIFLPTPVSF